MKTTAKAVPVTIGLDIAKNFFQVHGVDGSGQVVLRRKLSRGEVLGFFEAQPKVLVGIEACGTGHYWAREITALGHEVKLLPPTYVKAYVKRGKTDAADAEAICEAVTRPNMHVVPIKTPEQQAALMMHRSRELLVGQRTALVNALRGHLAELGIITAKGIHRVADLLAELVGVANTKIPPLARASLHCLAAQIEAVQTQIDALEALILEWHKGNEASRRLAKVPGVGPITASAVVATIGDASNFTSGRHLAAALGLTPRQNSSGGKARQGGISKAGNTYLRRLLFIGAIAVIRSKRAREASSWLARLIERRPAKVVAIALANKSARIIWAILRRGEAYRAPAINVAAAAAA
ncbi:MAG: IS110 family transposase [Rubrivivax sp.]